jgi:N12 class adenine-specific DNA methylase
MIEAEPKNAQEPTFEQTACTPAVSRQLLIQFPSQLGKAQPLEDDAPGPSAANVSSSEDASWSFPPRRDSSLVRQVNRFHSKSRSFPNRHAPSQPSLFDFRPSHDPIPAEPDLQAIHGILPSLPETCELRAYTNDSAHPPLSNPELRRPPPPQVLIASGEKGKARDILSAIHVLKHLEAENRPATTEERQTLARFAGFGSVALSIFPDPVTGRFKHESWEKLGHELEAALTPEEFASARRSTFNAFYTSPVVMAAMFKALDRLGLPENGLVLEPGCGIGNFMGQAPSGLRFLGVELDFLSGRIARALYPEHEIRIENFRDTRLPALDGVIGNVPFADLKLEYHGQNLSLHDYFFAKSTDALRPGGVLALVTSHFTLDKQNGALREYLGSKADFVGAIRLPSDAFKREGTAVVTDIVFLRKRAPGEPARHEEAEWHRSRPFEIEGEEISINRYFVRHPEMVLGVWSRKDTLYGEGYSVVGNGDVESGLQAAIERLPQFCRLEPTAVSSHAAIDFSLPPLKRFINEGSFLVRGDQVICQIVDGQAIPVVYGGTTIRSNGTHIGKRMASLIRIRDAARQVLESQNEGRPEAERQAARRDLNWAYDSFVCRYGPINKTTLSTTETGITIRRMPNLVKFREDPDATLVMSLEHYDEQSGTADKATIMRRDVVGKTQPMTAVQSAEEGLLVSLNERGTVDIPFMAELYGKPEDAVIAELGDLIYQDPECRRWQTADEYLSGNVRAKLAEAVRAGETYARNVEALRRVQPEDVLPGDIDANIGAPWIPIRVIQAFAAELFKVEVSSIAVAHLAKDAVWSLEADFAAKASVAATADYGTSRANGTWLLEFALNMKTPVIYDPDPSDPDKRVVNQEETLSAREKQRRIKETFRSWVFTDAERTESLVRIYNDTYNNLRARLFDGSHLSFPGMDQTITLRPHQTAAVWRGMSAGNTLLAHAVGAGKTYTMAATGMKMKQAGLIKKPMYVVPNHLLEQFAREFVQLYPNARLLVAMKEDLTRERRKFLTAKIASGEWDGIIVTHSSFERIGLSRDYQEKFLLEQIAEYDQLLREHAEAKGGNRNLIKTIEKQKAARAERLKELLAEDKKDDGLVFDELGADHIFVDEAQYYKNLETPSKMDRVAGIQTGGSERAFDVFMKARYLHEQHAGHGVTFATGTPISNTMVEMFTMQRFLDPEGLRTRGLEHFDAWAATFGEVVDSMEISPDGKTLKPRSRFAKFQNLPELQMMFRSFADVQTAEMLDLPRPALNGGKPAVVPSPMSEQQQEIQKELVERYERLRSQKVDPRVDNALAITTDGRKLALDARMLSAVAPEFPGSKVSELVANVLSIWNRTKATRGTQMIFCDMGVHPTPWGYSAYEEIIEKLVAGGIARLDIATIGEADSDAKKQALFEKVRKGSVRVLIGSTTKMGTGTNVQKRLVALHHLDAPWKPAEVEQREGRILRQGNENKEVKIYRYVTKGSFDAYIWQALETKARFIAQVMRGENTARRAEDIRGQELSYAEVKAIASGNPAVLTLAEADAELQRLALFKKNHLDEQYVARRSVRDLPATIDALSKRLSNLTEDQATAAAHASDLFTVGSRAFSLEDALRILADELDGLPRYISETRRVPLGIYRGLGFGVVLHPHFPPDLYLEGAASRHSMMSREHQGPRAILNAVERLASSYAAECDHVRQELTIAESQLRDYQERLGKPFPHNPYVSDLTELRDKLKAELSGKTREPGSEPPPSVQELAERIKALQACHSIESSPQRVQQCQPSAEEPTTTRILRRKEPILDIDRKQQADNTR